MAEQTSHARPVAEQTSHARPVAEQASHARPVAEQASQVRRKLIEVAMPLDVVGRHAAREKSIRHGHPSTLHLWWSRKPLAAARAVVFAQLVDDPGTRPDRFPTSVEQDAERQRLLGLVGRLAAWDATEDGPLMEAVRAEVASAVAGAAPGGAPGGAGPVVVWDPFAGGGSIPLEAQRLGLPVVAGDLNPVAVLIERALLELPRRWWGRQAVTGGAGVSGGAGGLAADLRAFGAAVLATATRRLRPLYPRLHGDGGEHEVAAYLWVRTVPCGNPACPASVPMLSNPWLRRTVGREAWLRSGWDGARLRFEVVHDPHAVVRTGRGAVFTCVACGTPTTADDVKGRARDAGLGRALRCVVPDGTGARRFVVVDEAQLCPWPGPGQGGTGAEGDDGGDEAGLDVALDGGDEAGLDVALDGDDEAGLDVAPDWDDEAGLDVELDPAVTNAPTYGVPTIADLHLPRQRRALAVFAEAVRTGTGRIREAALAAGWSPSEADAYARDLTVLLGLVFGRLSNRMSTACIWNAHRGLVEQTFIQNNAIAFPWDFAEANPLSGGSGSWATQLELVARVVERSDPAADALVVQADARVAPPSLHGRRVVVSTDPPYFDYFLYSSLSDYFYVWLRRALRDVDPDLFTTIGTPRRDEIVARRADGDSSGARFLDGLTAALTTIARTASPDFPVTVYYAYRSTRAPGTGLGAWEAFLAAVRSAGLVVTATWPIRTERTAGVKTGRNSLASSIVVVCRPRPADAPRGDRRELITRLRAEIPAAVARLQACGTSPVDLAQAAVGPGMAVYTGYAEVIDVDGRPMPVGVALELVNQVLDEALARVGSDLDPPSRFCLAWFEQYGFEPGPFGAADGLAKVTGTVIAALAGRGLLQAGAGTVRLLAPGELAGGSGAGRSGEGRSGEGRSGEGRLPVWELVVRLAGRLAAGGTVAAADLLRSAGEQVDVGACRDLAYTLFTVCGRRGWTAVGGQVNALGTAFPELVDLARGAGDRDQGRAGGDTGADG
jgi:putative DNA methylase